MIILAALATATLSLLVTPTVYAGAVELRLPRVRRGQPQPACVCSPTGAIGAALDFGPLPARQAGEVTGPLVATSYARATWTSAAGTFSTEAQCSIRPRGRVVTYPLGADPVRVPLGDLGAGEGVGATLRTWRAR